MESDKKMEMIEKAIRKVMADEEIKANTHGNREGNEDEEAGGQRRQLMSKLLSELEESYKHGAEEADPSEEGGSCSNEEIMKEVKKVKRQNSITHHLLTILILITLAWQLSEVSLILKIKDGIRNPFRSLAGIIKGFRPKFNLQKAMEENHQQVSEFSGLKLPHLDLTGFCTSNDEEEEDDDDD